MGGTKERGGERRVLELSRPSRGRRGTKTTKTKAKGGYGCPSCLGFGVLVARRALEEESDEMAGRGGKERCVELELVLIELLKSKQSICELWEPQQKIRSTSIRQVSRGETT